MKEANKKIWDMLMSLIKDPVRKAQLDKFIVFLKEKTSYFTAPASPKYHCSWEEGLLEHSLNVAQNAVRINRLLNNGDDEEEVIIGALFHDLGKAYIDDNQPYYTFAEPTANQKKYGFIPYPAFKYNDAPQVFMTVPQRSVRLITQYIDISDALYQAILIHDGQYCEENHPYGCKENPLALIMHYADSWAGFIQEGKLVQSADGRSYEIAHDEKLGAAKYEVRRSMVNDVGRLSGGTDPQLSEDKEGTS